MQVIFIHCHVKVVVAMVMEIVKLLHHWGTYVLQTTPVS